MLLPRTGWVLRFQGDTGRRSDLKIVQILVTHCADTGCLAGMDGKVRRPEPRHATVGLDRDPDPLARARGAAHPA